MLADACGSAATPHIRNMATVGGNLLQELQCWYFRSADFQCLRKGKDTCFAFSGLNQYHAIMDYGGCPSVAPSSAAVAVLALDGSVELVSAKGKRTVASFHRELGKLMWDYCGMSRNAKGLEFAIGKVRELRQDYWQNVDVVGSDQEMNQALEHAGRVADFLELAELMCTDALQRTESCGGHFRVESQTPEGEAKRDDANFCYVAAWEWKGAGNAPALHKEPLAFEYIHLAQRSYK